MTTAADKLRALQIVVQVYRYAMQPEPFWPGAPGRLAGRFSDILAKGRAKAVFSANEPMGTIHASGFVYPARRAEFRASRNALASILTCREITSFNDLFGGEIKALMESEDLEEILIYLLESNRE